MKKILILGASVNQVPLISRAKNLGIFTVVCDFRTNVPGVEIADIFYNINCFDIDKVVEIGKLENVQGIVTNSEPLFITMSKIAKILNVRCLNENTVCLFKDKYLMREFCKRHGILHPKYKRCSNISEAIEFFETIDKKCIIKPLDNSASKGVYSVNTREDLYLHFDECISNSLSVEKAIIIEEYITGVEFTIDGIKTLNGHKSLAISEKKHYKYNENVAFQLFFSNFNEHYDYAELRKINDMLVNQTDMEFGLTHAEYKYSDGKFYLIEIQARGGGNFIATDIVPYISNVDSYDVYISWSVNEDIDIDYSYENLLQHNAVLHFFDVPGEGGKVIKIEGEELLKSKTIKYDLLFKVGDVVNRALNDNARIGYYIAYANTELGLRTLMNQIDDTFKIIVE